MSLNGEKVTLFRIRQGTIYDESGKALWQVMVMLLEHAAKYLREFPNGAKYWQPPWQILNNLDEKGMQQYGSCPLGFEQYRIDQDGILRDRVTNWDSSG